MKRLSNWSLDFDHLLLAPEVAYSGTLFATIKQRSKTADRTRSSVNDNL